MWLSTNLQVCLHSHTFNYFLCEMFLAHCSKICIFKEFQFCDIANNNIITVVSFPNNFFFRFAQLLSI